MGVRLWRGFGLNFKAGLPCDSERWQVSSVERGNGQEPILLMWAWVTIKLKASDCVPKTKLRTCKLCLVPGSDSWLAEKQLWGLD